MKALTLRQPSASLVAVGVKKIETRSWSTAYRGRIAIHAAKHEPPTMMRALRWTGGVWSMEYGGRDDPTWYLAANAPSKVEVASLPDAERLPLGAVVASATLVDVVPIVVQHEDAADLGTHYITATSRSAFLWHPYDQEPHDETMRDYPGEAPFGDFSLGRFAWLLDDVARVEDRCPWCWSRGEEKPDLDFPIRPRFCAACDPMLGKRRDVRHVYEGTCTLTGKHPPAAVAPGEAENAAYVHEVEAHLRRADCPVCSGAGKCAPIPARGRQGLWEWTP